MAKNSIPNQAHYVPVDQLRIGLYVYIDLPWFQHPFTLNSFRIVHEQQLRTLRALGEPRFRYDPERSEPLEDTKSGEQKTDPAAPPLPRRNTSR